MAKGSEPKLPTARKTSTAATPDGEWDPSTGELAMVGFTHVPYEKARPLRHNEQTLSTRGSIGGGVLGQDGTSVTAYEFQPHELQLNDGDGKELEVSSKNQEK